MLTDINAAMLERRAATGSSTRVWSATCCACRRMPSVCRSQTAALTASPSALDCATSPTRRARWRLDAARAQERRPTAGAGILEAHYGRRLQSLYDAYSFRLLPLLGRMVAGDADSYRYLAESIRRHPDQETLLAMLREARSRGLPLSQPDGRHRRRASRLQVLAMFEAQINSYLSRRSSTHRARSSCASSSRAGAFELDIVGFPAAAVADRHGRRAASRARRPARRKRRRPTSP